MDLREKYLAPAMVKLLYKDLGNVQIAATYWSGKYTKVGK